MKPVVIVSVVSLAVIGFLAYRTFDTGLSLEYARANSLAQQKTCETFSGLVTSALKGKTLAEAKALAPPGALVKDEGSTTSINDVILQHKAGVITQVDTQQTCN